MQRERVTESIHVFTSDLYVQVTASLVVTDEVAILIDTLVYPEETLQIRRFAENRLGVPVKMVINTHHHADHTLGTCFFPDAQIIAHRTCRELLDSRGRESLERAKNGSSEMDGVELVLPDTVFDGELEISVGNKTLRLWHSPGHSADSISILVVEDQILFAGDALMPIPFFVDGSYDDYLATLRSLRGRSFESIVQGHGEVVLRGEIDDRIQNDIDYLEKLSQAVDRALSQPANRVERALQSIRIEACGKSHILLNGAAEELHRQNVLALASQRRENSLLRVE